MSQVSPHDRESEARTHRNGYALLAAALTVLASLTLWGKQLQNSEAGVNEAAHVLQPNLATPESWRERIESLREQAACGDAAEALSPERQTAASSLADALEAVDLVAVDQDGSRWPVRVDRLLSGAVLTSASDKNRSPTDAARERTRAEISASIARTAQERQQAAKKAIDEAIAEVQAAREADLRAATLSIRDAQDQVEQLNTAIQRTVSGLKDQQAQAARAAALARDLAEVRSLLSPFITPGHFQPPSGGGHKYERTTDAKPVSLSRLQGAGALDPTQEGLTYLLRFGGSRRTRGNRRPLGSFPAYQGYGSPQNDRNMPRVQRAQALLRQHGQALVEAKLLSE